ncbi:MAG: hypothetical protein Q9163_005622 [Psora crenata]
MATFSKPPRLPPLDEIVGRGGVGWIFKVTDEIVVKVPRPQKEQRLKNELVAYKRVEKHGGHPNIVQPILSVPEQGLFLPFLRGRSLTQRARENQIRTEDSKFVKVVATFPTSLVEKWLSELCHAVAWLEGIGYVHGDLAPRNVMFDHWDRLFLIDLEHMDEIGKPSGGNEFPYARWLGSEAGEDEGTFGRYGAETEQLAIGSILYLMAKGHEVYEPDLEKHQSVMWEKFQNRVFPALGISHLDGIIQKCWWGEYSSIKQLADEATNLNGARDSVKAVQRDTSHRNKQRIACQALVNQGLLMKEHLPQFIHTPIIVRRRLLASD